MADFADPLTSARFLCRAVTLRSKDQSTQQRAFSTKYLAPRPSPEANHRCCGRCWKEAYAALARPAPAACSMPSHRLSAYGITFHLRDRPLWNSSFGPHPGLQTAMTMKCV